MPIFIARHKGDVLLSYIIMLKMINKFQTFSCYSIPQTPYSNNFSYWKQHYAIEMISFQFINNQELVNRVTHYGKQIKLFEGNLNIVVSNFIQTQFVFLVTDVNPQECIHWLDHNMHHKHNSLPYNKEFICIIRYAFQFLRNNINLHVYQIYAYLNFMATLKWNCKLCLCKGI